MVRCRWHYYNVWAQAIFYQSSSIDINIIILWDIFMVSYSSAACIKYWKTLNGTQWLEMCKAVSASTLHNPKSRKWSTKQYSGPRICGHHSHKHIFSPLFPIGSQPTTLPPHNPVKFCAAADLEWVLPNKQQSLQTKSSLICIYLKIKMVSKHTLVT